MTFVMLDSLSLPGDAAKPNEDAFGHDGGAAVVMDGATMLGDGLMPGNSDAAWIAQFGARRVLAHLRGGDGARKALRGAMEDARKSFEALRRMPPEDVWQTPCASTMLAVQDKNRVELLWLGDCAALLKNGEDAVIAIGETLASKSDESGFAARLAKARGQAATDRAHFIEDLRARRNRLNSGGYWLFSPEPKAAAHAGRRVVKVKPGAHLLLASDGFLALVSDYGAYSADSLMAAARDKGLAALGDELRAIEASDPDGARFARFKKSDDATALLMRMD
jgi:serine/threonine protein phosphatase PrpC